jgi:hypothetical protein
VNPQEALQVIKELGVMLEPTAQHVFQLAVRESYIRGARSLFAALVGWTLVYITFRLAKVAMEKGAVARKTVQYTSDDGTVEGLAATLIGIIGLSIALTAMDSALKYLLNPELQAILILLGK